MMAAMPSRQYVPPRDWTVGDTWPSGPFRPGVPRYVLVTASIVSALAERRGSRSLRNIAAKAGIAHTTLQRLMDGKHVPDVGVVVALEDAVGAALWPCEQQHDGDRED